mmetsp:Transcript_9927/g.15290  ORF Transcript_9927/g.15290 Transcript_9927/m.15290 type:complete len:479 (+) Transcript_9927:1439-2875(+)
MCFCRINDIDGDFITAIRACNRGSSNSGNINRGEIIAHLVAGNGGGVVVDFIGKLFGCGSTIFAVVLDTKVLFGSTRVVTGSQNERTKGFLPDRSALTDNSRNSRSRQKTILTNPETLDTIGNTHLHNGLNCLIVEVTSISSDNQRSLRNIGSSGLDGIKCSLYEVVQVVFLHEFLGLLTKSGSSRFLSSNRARFDRGGLERSKAGSISQIQISSHFSSRDQLGFITCVHNADISNKTSFFAHADQSLNGKTLALHKRGDSTFRGLLQGTNHLVLFAVKTHNRCDSIAKRVEFRDDIIIDDVGVTAQQQQVIALFHGSETGTRDRDSACTSKALNSGTHGSFQLKNLLRAVILGVNSLFVHDHWKRDKTTKLVNDFLKLIKTDPQVIGVEITMLANVLEVLFILIRAHGRFTKDKLLIFIAYSQVASLLVIFSTLAAFHHEGCVFFGKVGQNFKIKSSSKVVGVGNKHVFESILEKGI